MTELIRVKTRWDGFLGGPGYSVMHFRGFGSTEGGGGDVDDASAAAAVNKVWDFFRQIPGIFPAAARITVEGEVDAIEDSTGALTNSFSGATKATISGTATGNYSAAAGGIINWRTGAIRNRRKIRGRTFLVPLAASAFRDNGQLSQQTIDTIRTVAAPLMNGTNGPQIGVYARETIKGAADGQFAVASSMTIPTSGAILRSRRD